MYDLYQMEKAVLNERCTYEVNLHEGRNCWRSKMAAETFQDGVAHLLMMVEELRRSCESETTDMPVIEWRFEMDQLVPRLDFLIRKSLDDPGDEVKKDMYNHCQRKVLETSRRVLQTVTSPMEGKAVWDGGEQAEDAMEGQAAIARIAELCLVVHFMVLQGQQPRDQTLVKETVERYANYQKQLLRQRSKPPIAYLAQWRTTARHHQPRQQLVVEDEDDDDDTDHSGKPHSDAITAILGQASALIHPLLEWRENLPPGAPIHELCQTSIDILDDQAQMLTQTVSNWLLDDRKVEDWMRQTGDNSLEVDLTSLDSLVEEMAFCCQVLSRYDALVPSRLDSPKTIAKELLPEFAWKYAALERYLGVQQLKSALRLATPVNIVMGQPIKVPSVVEDAQYLSTRALERATSTRSIQAMGTVAHSLSHDIWSTDLDGGVYQALIDQQGCWSEPETTKPKNHLDSGPASSGFTSALLDALDEDLKKSKSISPVPSAPTSGGFLGSLVGGGQQMQLVRLETQLCAMNGIHAAAGACESLGQSLNVWLSQDGEESTSSMTKLAEEELIRYSRAYQKLLQQQIDNAIGDWCGFLEGPPRRGMCLHDVRIFFANENFELDSKYFGDAEADERLERFLINPIRESLLISHLDRCDFDVATQICQHFSSVLSSAIMETLWNNEKRFTDWGSLLLSKQVRLLQNYVGSLVSMDETGSAAVHHSLVDAWERLSQIVTVLQLERPADWSIYQSTSVLGVEELKRTLRLRTDFSPDAIATLCNQVQKDET